MTTPNQDECRVCHRRRTAQRGASNVEYLVLLGLLALVGVGGFKALGNRISDKVNEQADTIRTLEAGEGQAVALDLPEPGPPLPLEELIAVTTVAATPGHLVHGAGHFVHAYEAWSAIVHGFKDTSLEQRWGANGVREKEVVPQEARKAVDAAIASLDQTRDADLVAKGKEILLRVAKVHGEALHGAPSDGAKTGFNKFSFWGGAGDLVGVETRLYPSVSKWREAARQVEKDVTDYMKEVKERNAKRRADDQLADFRKSMTSQRDDMVDKAKRLNTMRPDEMQAELEKALTQAFLKESLKQMGPGRPNPLNDWKTATEAAQREAAGRAKELVAKHPDAVRQYLQGYYADGIKAYNQALSYDPNAKPTPKIGPRP